MTYPSTSGGGETASFAGLRTLPPESFPLTYVFRIPDRDLEALVCVYADGSATLAFRPGYGTWGPPVTAIHSEDRVDAVQKLVEFLAQHGYVMESADLVVRLAEDAEGGADG